MTIVLGLGGLVWHKRAWLTGAEPFDEAVSEHWPQPILVSAPAARILLRTTDWQRATDLERRRAAEAVAAAAAPDFYLSGVEHFECLDQAFDIPTYVHKLTTLEFSLVPAGAFEMGAPANHPLATERSTPAHQVTLTKPFLVGRTPVTILAWKKVAFSPTDNPALDGDPGDAVGRVSWNDAAKWCVAAGLELPSEAEWEYAARAGTRGPWYYLPLIATKCHMAPYYRDAKPCGTTPASRIGRHVSNAFGLHDIDDNAAEWVRDGYSPYATGAEVDPEGSQHGSRVFRGSAFVHRWATADDLQRADIPVWDRRSPDWGDNVCPGLRAVRRIQIVGN